MARSPAQRVVGTLLFLAAFIAVLAFYFLLFADAQQLDNVPGVGETGIVAIAVTAVLAIVALVLILLLASRGGRDVEDDDSRPFFVPPEPEPVQTYETPAPAFEELDEDLVAYDLWRLPTARRAWALEEQGPAFYFPLHVEGGVYVNDYIPVGRDTRLKLRTLLAGPPDFESASFTIPAQAPTRRPERPEHARPLAEERRPERPAREPSREPARDLPGDHFMRELERRFSDGTEESPQVAVTASHYDYPGDVHPVIDVEGIGPVYAQRLRDIGIQTTARLCYEDAGSIAQRLNIARKTVESWQTMSQLMKISGVGPQYAEAMARAGIDIEALRRRDPGRIAQQVNEHLDGLGSTVTGGRVTERRVASWQEAAKAMRRVRMQAPSK